MGKQKVKMEKIKDISARQVTFSKRRQGLFKKAHELSVLCDAQVAAVVFSPVGRMYKYPNSNDEDILNKLFPQLDSEQHLSDFQGTESNPIIVSDEKIEDKINFLRQIRAENLQHFRREELHQLEAKLEEMLQYVRARKDIQKKTDAIKAQSSDLNLEMAYSPYPQQNKNTCLERLIEPPPLKIYRVNFAGAVLHDSNGSGVGVVVRNWHGEFMGAFASFWPGLMDPNIASSVAATRAIEFAIDYSFMDIVLEGDAFDTIQEFKHRYELQQVMQLGSCFFSYVHVSGNGAAHVVARYAKNVRCEAVWLMEEPDFLADVLRADQGLLPKY